MSATHATQSTVPQGPVLYMAIELSLATWKLAFTVGSGQKPRIRSVPAGALLFVIKEVDVAKKRFGLPEDATVMSRFEAGRDGFSVHRFLVSHEIQNIVVDPASIEVSCADAMQRLSLPSGHRNATILTTLVRETCEQSR